MKTSLDWNRAALHSQIIKNFSVTETGTWRYLYHLERTDLFDCSGVSVKKLIMLKLTKRLNFQSFRDDNKTARKFSCLWVLLSWGLVHARPNLNFFIMFFIIIDHPSQCNTIQFSLNHVIKLFQIKFAKHFTFKEQDNLLGLIRCIKYCGLFSKVLAPNLVCIGILGEITKTSWRET